MFLFFEHAVAAEWDFPAIVEAYGRLAALRSLVELAATPKFASWSDRSGRKVAICICCAAFFIECLILAFSRSLLTVSLVHVAGGLLASHNVIEGSCIADSCPGMEARAQSFEKLFIALGAAVTFGPAIGGELAAHRRTLPFIFSALISVCSLLYVVFMLPEYLPKGQRRNHDAHGPGACNSLGAFFRLLTSDQRLRWYIAASALSSAGISAFLSVRTLWAWQEFGWSSREIGRTVAVYGITLMVAQFFVLPFLLVVMRGQEALLAQLCLLIHAARFTFYALAPSGSWVVLIVLLGTAGNCSVPILQGLCSGCVAEDEHALLSGGASAVNTASQVLGALAGSSSFAWCLRSGSSHNVHLCLTAGCFFSAIACVAAARHAENVYESKPSTSSWLKHAEGMHGADAAIPAPTGRGSMLGRQVWVEQAGQNANNSRNNSFEEKP